MSEGYFNLEEGSLLKINDLKDSLGISENLTHNYVPKHYAQSSNATTDLRPMLSDIHSLVELCNSLRSELGQLKEKVFLHERVMTAIFGSKQDAEEFLKLLMGKTTDNIKIMEAFNRIQKLRV